MQSLYVPKCLQTPLQIIRTPIQHIYIPIFSEEIKNHRRSFSSNISPLGATVCTSRVTGSRFQLKKLLTVSSQTLRGSSHNSALYASHRSCKQNITIFTSRSFLSRYEIFKVFQDDIGTELYTRIVF